MFISDSSKLCLKVGQKFFSNYRISFYSQIRSRPNDRTYSSQSITSVAKSNTGYIQGQHPEGNDKNREYFYYIDHQGMLFLDDSRMKNFTSCFKEKKFLKFFFKQIKLNMTERYPEFPFLSLCGKERNFIRCDDLPIVFTHIIEKKNQEMLSYGYAGDELTVPFEPSKLCMQMETGRVYHPGPIKSGGVGLVRSKLAIQIAPNFTFDQGEEMSPTKFAWKGCDFELLPEVISKIEELKEVRKFSLGIFEN